MDVARLNLSHGPLSEQIPRLNRIRMIAATHRIPIGVLADLPGPKVRVGKISPEPVILRKGPKFTLTARRIVGDSKAVSITHPSVLRELRRDDSIFLADGTIRLTVEHVRIGEVDCRVTSGGLLYSGKGVNLPGKRLSLRTLGPKDLRLLRAALRNHVDFIGLSFVRNADDIIRAKRIVRQAHSSAWLIAKIEKREAVDNFDAIAQEADGIMVARGDLGIETGIDDIPLLQKRIIRKANTAGKPVITATQMLESMVDNPMPTRAEVADVANSIFDGTDAVMLSGETAVGKYPVEAVKVMRRVAAATENGLPYRAMLDSKRNLVKAVTQDAISYSACDVAYELNASCIVAHTRTGLTAHRVSKFRSSVPIIALTYSVPVMNTLSLLWGVRPYQVGKLRTTEEIFTAAKTVARASGFARKDSRIVVVCGDPSTPGGTTDLLRVQIV